MMLRMENNSKWILLNMKIFNFNFLKKKNLYTFSFFFFFLNKCFKKKKKKIFKPFLFVNVIILKLKNIYFSLQVSSNLLILK